MQYPEQTEGNLSRTHSHFDHEALAVNEHGHRANYVDASIDSQLDAADSVVPSPNGEVEVGSLKMTLVQVAVFLIYALIYLVYNYVMHF